MVNLTFKEHFMTNKILASILCGSLFIGGCAATPVSPTTQPLTPAQQVQAANAATISTFQNSLDLAELGISVYELSGNVPPATVTQINNDENAAQALITNATTQNNAGNFNVVTFTQDIDQLIGTLKTHTVASLTPVQKASLKKQ
jgi:PBP1b-binding outer membrane lipoprotein LpoB